MSDRVLITLVEFKGSVPQTLGAKATVTEIGLTGGTGGGGKVEAKAILLAQEILKNPESPACRLANWNLTTDVGMTCGGTVTFLFELQRAQVWKIAVFGAGHVAQELVPMLSKLNCHVTCVDTRAEWLEKLPVKENITKLLVTDLKSTVATFAPDCFFVLMTQGHATDLPVLTEILSTRSAPYVGVIGSKTKALTLRAGLKQLDLPKEKIESFFCPVGLSFGNNTPLEISHSVVAQLLQERDRK